MKNSLLKAAAPWRFCIYIFLLFNLSIQGSAQSGNTCHPSINITHLPYTLCPGHTPSFTATAFDAGANPIYQWKVNRVAVGDNRPVYSGPLSVSDEVICELTTTGCSNNTSVISNHFVFQNFDRLTPEVTTVASREAVCNGTAVTFTATNKSGSANVSYQWFVNGSSPAGTNSTTFSANIIKDSSVVQCMMTVPTCLTSGGSTKDYADPIVIRIPPPLKPAVTIATTTPVTCKGNAVGFTAAAMQAGNNPSYQWNINSASTSATGPFFSTTTLTDGDVVSCSLSIDAALNCGMPASAVSNSIAMKVNNVPPPSISIGAAKEEICSGMPVSFIATVINGGSTPFYQWQVNQNNTGSNSPVYSTSLLNNGDKISCTVIASSGCNAAAASNTIAMVVDAMPVITAKADLLTVWAGEQARPECAVSSDVAFYTWMPASQLNDPSSLTPVTVPLMDNISYRLTAVSGKGCTSSKEVQVKVLHKLYMPNSFTPNKDGINDVFRIPPGVPLELKEFSVFDRWGNCLFSTKDINLGWDGIYRGAPASTGAYIYLIRGRYQNQEIAVKGSAVLLR